MESWDILLWLKKLHFVVFSKWNTKTFIQRRISPLISQKKTDVCGYRVISLFYSEHTLFQREDYSLRHDTIFFPVLLVVRLQRWLMFGLSGSCFKQVCHKKHNATDVLLQTACDSWLETLQREKMKSGQGCNDETFSSLRQNLVVVTWWSAHPHLLKYNQIN